MAAPVVAGSWLVDSTVSNLNAGSSPETGPKIKISLNAYSFNTPLRSGEMTLADLLEFTASCGFEAIDITGYYFPGYPEIPSRQVVNDFKRRAFLLGLDISGTGVRNDFTAPETANRKNDINLVKRWIELAADLGAPVVRIFAGRRVLQGADWQEAARWVADGINECADYGSRYGVMIALQNHAEFLKTAEQVKTLFGMVNSDWAGLMLDIGSYPTDDPYRDIADNVSLAISWQVKENIRFTDRSEKTDFRRIVQIARDAGYRGYMPLETLGQGDPALKVRSLLRDFKKALRETA
jgi:sugar phosphate isomerase/epimerase